MDRKCHHRPSTLHSMQPRKQSRVRAGSFYPTLGRFHLILLHFLPQILSAFVSLASPWAFRRWLGACVCGLINASRNLKVFIFMVRVWKIRIGDGHHQGTRVVNPKDSGEYMFIYLQYPSISYNVVACHHTNTVQYPYQAAVTCALVMCIYISLSMCIIQIDPRVNLKLFISEGLLILYQSLGIQTAFSCWVVLCAAMCQDLLSCSQWRGDAARQPDLQTSWQRMKIRISMHFHAFPCISMHFHAFPCISMHFHAFPCISTLSIVSLCVSITVRKVSCLQCWLTLPCPRLSDTICRIQTIPSSDNRELQLSFSVGAEHQWKNPESCCVIVKQPRKFARKQSSIWPMLQWKP